MEFLRAWESVDDETLRRSSVILRRLVNDGEYQRAWMASGFEREPRVVAPRLESILDRAEGSKVGSAIAGGGEFQGSLVGGFIESNVALPPLEVDDFEFGLTRFASSCGIFAGSRRIKRSEVIGYVANALGGAHFDQQIRKDAYKALQEYDERGTRLLDKSPVYFELMSIGQLLARAPDAERFMDRARDLRSGA